MANLTNEEVQKAVTVFRAIKHSRGSLATIQEDIDAFSVFAVGGIVVGHHDTTAYIHGGPDVEAKIRMLLSVHAEALYRAWEARHAA